MSHYNQIAFLEAVKQHFPQYFRKKRVLEIGSLDINGMVRGLFTECDYCGLDVANGPGVDIVCQGQDYAGPPGFYDAVLCCEVMEHNPHWARTMLNMFRLCQAGGLIIMTCASTGFPEHGTERSAPQGSPLTIALGWDYYRNLTARDFRKAIPIRNWMRPFAFYRERSSWHVFFVGFRRGARPPRGAYGALLRLRMRYLWRNAQHALAQVKKRSLILLVGDERYNAGPVRFW